MSFHLFRKNIKIDIFYSKDNAEFIAWTLVLYGTEEMPKTAFQDPFLFANTTKASSEESSATESTTTNIVSSTNNLIFQLSNLTEIYDDSIVIYEEETSDAFSFSFTTISIIAMILLIVAVVIIIIGTLRLVKTKPPPVVIELRDSNQDLEAEKPKLIGGKN